MTIPIHSKKPHFCSALSDIMLGRIENKPDIFINHIGYGGECFFVTEVKKILDLRGNNNICLKALY
jgi:hypothetical protein